MFGDGGAPRPLRASDADREHTADQLGQAMADGRLSADEHSDRIGRLYGAKTHDELASLTADLGTGRAERRRSAVRAERVSPQVVILSSSHARPTGYVDGRITGLALLGEARIDLAHATLGKNGVDITVQAILGSVNIVVPPDARVSMTGFPLLGSLSPTREPGPADGPPVRVTAFVLVGSVTIHRAEAKSDA